MELTEDQDYRHGYDDCGDGVGQPIEEERERLYEDRGLNKGGPLVKDSGIRPLAPETAHLSGYGIINQNQTLAQTHLRGPSIA